MCTVNDNQRRALVCDLALPHVQSALSADPALSVEYIAHPTDGTELRIRSGDVTRFTELVRAAVAKANQ